MTLVRPRPAAGVFLCVAPVAAVGVDGVAAEVLAGGGVDDLDGVGVDEHERWGAGMSGADSEVVHAAGAAQGDFSVAVDDVDSKAVRPGGALLVLTRGGFDGGVGLGRSAPVRAVDAFGDVEGAEPVELVL